MSDPLKWLSKVYSSSPPPNLTMVHASLVQNKIQLQVHPTYFA